MMTSKLCHSGYLELSILGESSTDVSGDRNDVSQLHTSVI